MKKITTATAILNNSRREGKSRTVTDMKRAADLVLRHLERSDMFEDSTRPAVRYEMNPTNGYAKFTVMGGAVVCRVAAAYLNGVNTALFESL